jgi:dGTPase
MSDDFYNAFDREYLSDDFNRARTADYRSVFHQDRDRVMFTTAFRRLQAKTQVFQAGEYDFYRTRLTHSLEVANIAKSIAVWLRKSAPAVAVDPDLLEAICLAHDIGHPPFGHAGERVLNALMENYGGFEGNAQTLRILTRTIYNRKGSRGGMSPTRALLDGVLKYKRPHRERGKDTNHFIYDDQLPILEFCFGTTDLRAQLGEVAPNDFHSLECQIMDHADDVAYSCYDIIDGAKARFLTADNLELWRAQRVEAPERVYADELLKMLAEGRLESAMNHIIGDLIQAARIVPAKNFMAAATNRYAYALEIRPEAKARIRLHKRVSRDLVYGTSLLHQIEFKGTHVLNELTAAFFDNYLGAVGPEGSRRRAAEKALLTADVHRAVIATDGEAARARLLCDHLAGMTDAYALRSYKRLFDPDYGSISELI